MITMGSPLGHLYGFYFKEYAEIDVGIASICGRLGSWTNLYRVDDSIGRHVGEHLGGLIENRIMPAGGHRNYWRERVVSQVIFDRIRGNVDTSTASMEAQVRPARV